MQLARRRQLLCADEGPAHAHPPCSPPQAAATCEPPNSRLYHFTGNLELPSPLSDERMLLPVPPASVLLRGCSLRNTRKVHGLVLYAGAGGGGARRLQARVRGQPLPCVLLPQSPPSRPQATTPRSS
jgi:hypothetical protein